MAIPAKISQNFIRFLRVVITPSVAVLRGENDSKQSDEFQAIRKYLRESFKRL